MQRTINKDVVFLARTNFRGQNKLFGIKRSDRRQHTYIVGKTGTGKSALQHNMIVQDIVNGEGLCVVDPHGELVERVLEKVPEERVNDVVYFNPADPDFHIGFNPLELPDPKYKNLVASGLMGIFTKIWSNVWSARMEYILNNAILALLENKNSTLLGIARILVDKDYRQEVISNVKDPVVKAFWVNEFESWRDQFRNEAVTPIQNKVGQFLSTSMIRNIVGQAKSTINIFEIMNTGKIFLVNVSKGRIGEDNASLLGSMLITTIQLAAMERVRIPEESRRDFFLYVDEFQNFVTDSFAGILSEARKYRLNLTIAHQYIGQLVSDQSTRVRDAVFGNTGTMIIFRIGGQDAEFLLKEFEPELTEQDFVNLPNHSIYIKLMVNGVTSRPFSASTIDYFKVATTPDIVKRIYQISQHNYAKPKKFVEDEINRWSGVMQDETESGQKSTLPQKVTVGDTVKYRIACSLCNKSALVPFEPKEGRAVYCQDCVKKIKAGEAEPVRIEKPEEEVTEKSQEKYKVLSDLGIEYEGVQTKNETKKEKTKSEALPKKSESLSLKSLLPKHKVNQHKDDDVSKIRPTPDMQGLRVALNEALIKAEQDTESIN